MRPWLKTKTTMAQTSFQISQTSSKLSSGRDEKQSKQKCLKCDISISLSIKESKTSKYLNVVATELKVDGHTCEIMDWVNHNVLTVPKDDRFEMPKDLMALLKNLEFAGEQWRRKIEIDRSVYRRESLDVEEGFCKGFTNANGCQAMAQLLRLLLPVTVQVDNIGGCDKSYRKCVRFDFDTYEDLVTDEATLSEPGSIESLRVSPHQNILPEASVEAPIEASLIKYFVPDVLASKDENVIINVSVKSGYTLYPSQYTQLKYELLSQLQRRDKIFGVIICARTAKMVCIAKEDNVLYIKDKSYNFDRNLTQDFQALCHDIATVSH